MREGVTKKYTHSNTHIRDVLRLHCMLCMYGDSVLSVCLFNLCSPASMTKVRANGGVHELICATFHILLRTIRTFSHSANGGTGARDETNIRTTTTTPTSWYMKCVSMMFARSRCAFLRCTPPPIFCVRRQATLAAAHVCI